MNAHNLSVIGTWDAEHGIYALQDLAESICKYEIVHPRQVLKSVNVEELHTNTAAVRKY